jgi:hypothetical protein
MEHYEMAELLSQKAHVSLEQARQALIDNNWDILDAIVALERRGKGSIPTVDVETDEQLWGGYWWDTSDYPPCPDNFGYFEAPALEASGELDDTQAAI